MSETQTVIDCLKSLLLWILHTYCRSFLNSEIFFTNLTVDLIELGVEASDYYILKESAGRQTNFTQFQHFL